MFHMEEITVDAIVDEMFARMLDLFLWPIMPSIFALVVATIGVRLGVSYLRKTLGTGDSGRHGDGMDAYNYQ
jgi:hypothetical protein